MEHLTDSDRQNVAAEIKQLKSDSPNAQAEDMDIQTDTLQTPVPQQTGIKPHAPCGTVRREKVPDGPREEKKTPPKVEKTTDEPECPELPCNPCGPCQPQPPAPPCCPCPVDCCPPKKVPPPPNCPPPPPFCKYYQTVEPECPCPAPPNPCPNPE